MYEGDSIFTLGLLGGAGLVLVSALLVLAVLALARRISRGRGLAGRLVAAVLLFWGFLWLTPQVYYAYYQIIFHGLPIQLVLGWPPAPKTVVERLIFSGPATLAAHGQGVLGWVLIVLAAVPRLFGRVP